MATLETRINSYTTNNQSLPDVARLEDGRFVVTWSSFGQDGEGHGIYYKIFTAETLVQSGFDIRANTYTTSTQTQPAITALKDGGFVIAWQSSGQDGDSWGIYAQRFDHQGIQIGPEFNVNTDGTSGQDQPDVAGLADGGWVVVWEDDAADGDSSGIAMQRYNALGIKVGPQTLVNSTFAHRQDQPSVLALDSGGWVVAWASQHVGDNSAGDREVFFQRYDASGLALGGETQISTLASTHDDTPKMAQLSNGDFVVTWEQNLGGNAIVYGRVYEADGTPRTGVLMLSDPAIAPVSAYSDVAALEDGGFAVTWQAFNTDDEVYLREFSANGTPRAEQFVVGATGHRGGAGELGIVALEGGGTGVVWGASGGEVLASFHGQATDRNDYLTLQNGQFLDAKAGDDYVTGSAENDTLVGGVGEDTLNGGDGNDLLILGGGGQFGLLEIASGGGGDDVLVDWSGNARLLGGAGDDVLRGGADRDTLEGGNGFDILRGGTGDDSLSGGFGGDQLRGGDGIDTLQGGQGNDLLLGETGDDQLWGNDNSDTINGGAGNDLLNAGGHADTLNGASGDDTMTGGWGADRFIFGEAGFGNDVITDYQDGLDRLVVWNAVALGFGDVTITDLGNNALVEMGNGSVLVMGGGGVLDATDFVF